MNTRWETEEEQMLAELISSGDVFINNGWWDPTWKKDAITVHVVCNDTFAYACADTEDLPYNQIRNLYVLNKADPELGLVAWCIWRRKQRPIKIIEQMLMESGLYDIEELLSDK